MSLPSPASYGDEMKRWLRAWFVELDGIVTQTGHSLSWKVSHLSGLPLSISLDASIKGPLVIRAHATVGQARKAAESEVHTWIARNNLEALSPFRIGVTENGVVQLTWVTDSSLLRVDQVFPHMERFYFDALSVARRLQHELSMGPLRWGTWPS